MNSEPEQQKGDSVKRGRRFLIPAIVLLVAAIAAGATLLPSRTPVQPVTLVNSFPHDPGAFCQGLVFHKNTLLEGTGQYNESRLRLVDLKSGKPIQEVALAGNIFGEGVTVWQNTILQLTWKNGYLITYDASTFKQTGTIALRQIDSGLYEGWGITHDGKNLIISDGSSVLRFVNPQTFQVVRRMRVRDGVRAISKLNELEVVNGEILANVWYRDQIARIDPSTGRVKAWLDVSHLRPQSVRGDREAVLNGIAWDPTSQRLFVTGKNWPKVFEVRF